MVEIDTDDRIRTLEKGQSELREDIHSIRGTLQVMQRDGDTLTKKFDRFLENQEKSAKESAPKPLTATNIVTLGVSLLGACSILLGGGVWMISRFTEPVQTAVASLASQTSDRFNSQATQINNRLDTFQDSIRSIREGDLRTSADIGSNKVSIGRLEDRTMAIEKFKDSWNAHDWPGVNATQSAEIAANRGRIERLEHDSERDQQRFQDRR